MPPVAARNAKRWRRLPNAWDDCWARTLARRAHKSSSACESEGRITWEKVETWRAWAQLSEGLRAAEQRGDWTHEEIWHAYIQLTQDEAAFLIQKTDLSLRPVWHQKDRVLALFWSVSQPTSCGNYWDSSARSGLGDEPRRAGRTRRTPHSGCRPHHERRSGIRTRCITQPTDRNHPRTPGLGVAQKLASDSNVVTTFRSRSLTPQQLTSTAGEVGLISGGAHWRRPGPSPFRSR